MMSGKTRYEWFQTDDYVTISIFIKKVSQQDVSITFLPRLLSVTVKLAQSDYSLELEPLTHEIDPQTSSYQILSTQIEVKLKKSVTGIKWGALEGEEVGPTSSISTVKPEYPSSSKKKHNWDAISKQVEEEKPEGEQALNALFHSIYANASDDTKRAMMKSFQESNGTCLSTNWEEVGSKKVEVTPPEGMVAKKFEL